MHSRCRPDRDDWTHRWHAARGVSVCGEWASYDRFHAWAVAHGYADDLRIDRLNKDGNYEPENCLWTKIGRQLRKSPNTIWVEHEGTKICLAEAVEELGLEYLAVYDRHIRRGRTFREVVNELLRTKT